MCHKSWWTQMLWVITGYGLSQYGLSQVWLYFRFDCMPVAVSTILTLDLFAVHKIAENCQGLTNSKYIICKKCMQHQAKTVTFASNNETITTKRKQIRIYTYWFKEISFTNSRSMSNNVWLLMAPRLWASLSIGHDLSPKEYKTIERAFWSDRGEKKATLFWAAAYHL